MGIAMDPQKKRLFDMEIDEISLVDRGANQHAAIVFSKALDPEEDYMPEVELYDADGDLVEALEEGDVVYDEEGNEYLFTEDPDQYEYEDVDGVYEYEDVGKGFSLKPVGQYLHGFKTGGRGVKAGIKDISRAAGTGAGVKGYGHGMATAEHLARNKRNYMIGGGVAGATGIGGGALLYGRRRNVEKSLGDVVMEELSKASNEDERSQIIAKAMEEVEVAKSQAEEAWQRVAAQDDAMLESAFISKAAEYNLPVDPVEFGQILKAASTVLDYDQLELLDQLFNGVGEALYEEIGYVGDTDNASVLDVVNGYVGELVGKSDYSPEELSTAVFEANPEAYDEYLSENRW